MRAVLIAPLLLLASCSGSGAPDVQISDAWVRETIAGQSGTAAYLTIVNRGSGNDRLAAVLAAPPVTASIHETSTSAGISSMKALQNGLEIPRGGSVALRPGGAHIMISGLTSQLHEGGTLKLRLRFERSGDKAVDFKVASAISGMSH